MDITPPPGAHDDRSGINGDRNPSLVNPTVGAAAAAQQPKVVQTAFIHKLYKYAFGLRVKSPMELTTGLVCSKTTVSNISSPGPTQTIAL